MTKMDDPLAKIFERFNRKERNLLIREILGYRVEAPPLGIDFRKMLEKTVGIGEGSLDGAWWATDFHFDWLAGALLTFMKGESPRDNGSKLIQGNQEDVDLVVVAHLPGTATPHHLILIEVKAHGHFTTAQYGSKINRLHELHNFYKELEKESPPRITFHHVLYSPTSPQKLVPKSWKSDVGEKVEHVHMIFTLPSVSILAVTRCDCEGRSDAGGEFWRCFGSTPHEDLSSERSQPNGPSSDRSL